MDLPGLLYRKKTSVPFKEHVRPCCEALSLCRVQAPFQAPCGKGRKQHLPCVLSLSGSGSDFPKTSIAIPIAIVADGHAPSRQQQISSKRVKSQRAFSYILYI